MKRVLLWTGIFLAGVLIGFEIAWLMGFLRGTEARRDENTVTITLSATVDGTERFVFTRENVWHEHGKWSPPEKVFFNDEPWADLSQPPPGWPELAANLELNRATIVTRQERDVIALEQMPDGFDVYFADSLMGAAKYSVTISIPRK